MVWVLVCAGFQAAREPSAKSTRNEIDEPPWLNLKRTIGWVRTRSSSSSSDMPRKVPDDSSATRRSGRLDRSSRAGSVEEAEAAALERAASVARTWRTPYTAPALPPAVIAPATSNSEVHL